MSRPPKPLKYPRRPIGPHESSQETEKPALRRPGCPFWPRPGSDPGRVRRKPQKGAKSAPLKLAGDPGHLRWLGATEASRSDPGRHLPPRHTRGPAGEYLRAARRLRALRIHLRPRRRPVRVAVSHVLLVTEPLPPSHRDARAESLRGHAA